jgi:hypothetical protein
LCDGAIVCRGDRWPLVQLRVLVDDIEHAFRGDELWDKLRAP